MAAATVSPAAAPKGSPAATASITSSASATTTTTLDLMERRLAQLSATAPNEAERQRFEREMRGWMALFSDYLKQKASRQPPLDWAAIRPPAETMVVPMKQLEACPDGERTKLLSKLAVLKLNGGLGTTMGCRGPKSVIEVHGDRTFLDLTVQQVAALNARHPGARVPLVLMNSFNTDEDTNKIIRKYGGTDDERIFTFNQSQYPRIYKDTLQPMAETLAGGAESKAQWYPPGHGDVFAALCNARDLLAELKRDGREYVFISNVDNLGATADVDILHFMRQHDCEYVMEVTDKTRADIKGGTLIEYEGRAKLLELAQVPAAKQDEFKSVKKFKIFNTNNIWIKLSAIEEHVRAGDLDMDIIVNPKVENGKSILQLERAVGAAIHRFKNARGINVPRSRFLPVKATSDLLLIQSNLYSLLDDGSLLVSPARLFPTIPLIKLGDEFKRVADFQARFKNIPNILELDHLTVSGDVTFGEDVVLRGTVIIVASQGCRIDIPRGSRLHNKVVTGNMRLVEH